MRGELGLASRTGWGDESTLHDGTAGPRRRSVVGVGSVLDNRITVHTPASWLRRHLNFARTLAIFQQKMDSWL